MDTAIGFFMVLVFLSLFIILIGFTYKQRAQVAKWLNYPYYSVDNREVSLTRKIEDAQAELQWIEKNRDKTINSPKADGG